MMWQWIHGLTQLRDARLVRDLGERRRHLRTLAEIFERFPHAKIESDVRLIAYQPDRLWLGDSASICAGTLLAFGDEHNGFGRITIGDRTWIGQYNNFRASGDADVHVGAGCLVSQFCTLVGTNHACHKGQPIVAQAPDGARRGVVLEDDVWLGAGVTVLPGVTVGRGAVVGANAVVTKDVPSCEIWAGVPALRIGQRE